MDVVTLALAKKGAKQYTDEAIAGIGKGIVYKGAVSYYNDLPNNASIGDCYSVLYTGTSGTTTSGAEYVWGKVNNGDNPQWIQLGSDLSNYVKNTDFATSDVAGVVKMNSSYATSTHPTSGFLRAGTRTYAQYLEDSNFTFIGKGTLDNVFAGKNVETANNKVTSLTNASTDTQYPSAKCVYDLVGNIETLLTTLDTGNGVE